ncbi:MAG: DUF4124 domain-containing protein [Candidatus Contendobacter sp.]
MNTKLLFLLVAILAIPAFGQAVYKCPDSSGTVLFQQVPCAGGQAIIQTKPKPIFNFRLGNDYKLILKSINEQKAKCLSIKDEDILSKNDCLKKVDEKISSECPLCFKSDKEILTIRAEDWMHLLQYLTKMSEKEAILAMEQYLEPSSATKQRALEYYEGYNKNNKDSVISSSVDDVRIDESEESALVRYTTIYSRTDKSTRTYTELTNWKKKDGVWYRTIESSSGHYN